jgi:cytochrome c biogenesis protein CcmG/thiol:disulfide interchange protein DsbE
MTVRCGLTLLFGLIIFLGGCRDDKSIVSSENGVVDFRLDTLEHGRFYLNQYRGKVVVLAFWSTWCTVCKSELVELKSLSAVPQYKNLVVAAVCNDPENIDDVKTITKSLGIDYPVLLDKNAKVFKKLKMLAVPTTVVIDQSGKVSFTREGYDSNIMKQIKTSAESLLASDGGGK